MSSLVSSLLSTTFHLCLSRREMVIGDTPTLIGLA
jgi:hypothetical protein